MMLITFSGLDGSGKSTLVDYLKEIFEKDNKKVAVSHMNYDVGVYSAIRFLVNKTKRKAGRPSVTHAPRDQAYQGNFRNIASKIRYKIVWNKSLRLAIYPVDVFIFLFYRFYIETLSRRILIMDRYFYDTLVDVTGARPSFRLRFLSWLTPTPNVSVYLDCSPAKALARKNEYSLDYLSRRRLSYQQLISDLPGMVVLSTDEHIETTRLSLASAVRERMGSH